MPMPRLTSIIHNNIKPMLRQPFTIHSHLHHLLVITLLLCDNVCTASANNEVLALYSWLHTSPSFSSSFSDWNPSDSNPCSWSYINCSSQNFVTEVTIQSIELALPFPSNLSSLPFLQKFVVTNANLTGSISPDIQYWSKLTVIDVSSNSLVGDIPSGVGKLQNLQDLILNSNQLTGQIPKELGDCSNLKNLLIFDNYLSGNLPVELGKLLKLEVIRAGGNKDIEGKIPDEIGDCQNLQVLGLADTKISGSIPTSLGKLSKLQTLSIYTTMLSGEIPPDIGNCSELIDLFLYENDLSGSLPPELGKLHKLEKMLLWQNSFDGTIPEEIGNCRSLISIDLSLNSFSGSIPWSFGNLSNLEELMLSSNNISGSIPSALSNATRLLQLQIDSNQISGTIPAELGLLTQLLVFFAWQNKLEGSIPSTLADCMNLEAVDLSHNELTSSLPPGLFELRNLTKLLLISNHISGSIPPEIGKCTSLIRLRLSDNRINGEIPREIGFLSNLSFLDLSENRLSGSVPAEIGNCSNLQLLNLSNNTIRGNLPSSLSSLTRLQVLDISVNKLVGQVPDNYGRLVSLNRLILSLNSLSGSIPSSLGHCSSLQFLDFSSNHLSGKIPIELFDIQSLEIALNLSFNDLSGIIPPQISSLNKLSVLDISHNKFEGEVMVLSGLENLVSLNISYNNFTGYLPDSKLFRQLSTTDIAGNEGLCSNGGDSCFISIGTPMGERASSSFRSQHRLKLAIALLTTLTVALAAFGAFAIFRARKMMSEDNDSEMGSESWPWQFSPFQKLNFTVEQVLKCLVEENVIGKGCSGVVYRAETDNGEVIAVKKLWPTAVAAGYDCQYDRVGINGGVRDSFSAEVKTLGSIRHKNIVRFLGCCWNRKTRLLMYDYMPNGSLGSLLHERTGGCSLEWELRYRIVLGAAQGLAYLHHDCVPPIVHRDIKANNILIGPEFEPYIADFGLAKLVNDADYARSSNTVAGSYGYIAPEYGYMMKITEKSDVYSYGVVVLEILTGKQPIDPTIPEGLHIVDWVKQRRGSEVEVLDPSVRARPESEIDEMLQTLGVALLCVNPTPDDRPTMKDVAAMLNEIRQEREEYVKVDMLLNGFSANNDNHDHKQDIKIKTKTTTGSSSFVGPSTMATFSRSSSSLIYSSSFTAK
ncbi:LRR receptor-like serine/threonine-protein kinase RGI2 [Humulus lupulus]|uniref:LRR receptor-like serine/threonine-protein kinase RGI2 n=1 Tax=Humulus lupulus TaxID=3486 RepID=UPI002B4034E2|nr:LRR receptor-like serine/threonine-protein kinase RGI2 [Humulus lupulus]